MSIETIKPPKESKRVQFICANSECMAVLEASARDGRLIRGSAGDDQREFSCPHCRWLILVDAKEFEVGP